MFFIVPQAYSKSTLSLSASTAIVFNVTQQGLIGFHTLLSNSKPAFTRMTPRAMFLREEDHLTSMYTASVTTGMFLRIKPASSMPETHTEKTAELKNTNRNPRVSYYSSHTGECLQNK